jgi:hypothetical protein
LLFLLDGNNSDASSRQHSNNSMRATVNGVGECIGSATLLFPASTTTMQFTTNKKTRVAKTTPVFINIQRLTDQQSTFADLNARTDPRSRYPPVLESWCPRKAAWVDTGVTVLRDRDLPRAVCGSIEILDDFCPDLPWISIPVAARSFCWKRYGTGRTFRNQPARSEQWYWEKVLYDLKRDRGV